MVIKDDTFVHFYHGPSNAESIPAHVFFLFDTSLSGDKLMLAKEVFGAIIDSMTSKDFFNLALFNGNYGKATEYWKVGQEVEILSCNTEIVQEVVDFINNLEDQESTNDNFVQGAIRDTINLVGSLSEDGSLPANAFSRIVLITDGRGESGPSEETLHELPIIAVGIGSDANMTFLENVVANGDGDLIDNIVKDIPVGDQLVEVTKRLHDVILKDIEFRYMTQDGDQLASVSHSQFQFLNRGSDIVVSGQGDDLLQNLKAIEIKGQAANGDFEERVPFLPSPKHLGCEAEITLCSLPAFQGKCVTLHGSSARLNKVKFHKKAVSAQISGTCSWMVFTKRNFKGKSVQLLPGAHEVLQGSLYQSIASLRVAGAPSEHKTEIEEDFSIFSNPLHQHNAYLKIKHALNQDFGFDSPVRLASDAALYHQFLTPYTQIEFQSDDNTIVSQKILTFQDLSPVFYQVNDPELEEQSEALRLCQKPVECQDNFHFEPLEVQMDDTDDGQCNGTLTLYTRPSKEGESLEVHGSLRQVYHMVNGGQMRSFKSNGNCCWLLFKYRFFVGTVTKICGDAEQPLWNSELGSLKKIAYHGPAH